MQALLLAGVLAALIGASQAAEAVVTTFPFCPCQSAVKFPPYKWTLTSKTTKGAETTYCYNIETFKYTGSTNYSCVNYDLRKIEIDTVIGCQGYIKDLYFNGTYLARSTQYFGDFGVVSKFTRGKGLPLASFDDMFAEKDGVSACFTLFGKCNTEEKFCAGGVPCQVAFFDEKNNCCPKPVSSSPPPPKSPSPPPPKSPSPPPPESPSPPPPKSPSPPPPESPSPPPPTPIPSPSPPPPVDVPLAPGELFPPPPPAGGSDFPYCPCNRTAAGPYSFTGPKISADPGGTKYCFTLTTKRVDGDYPCANYDLRKIELDINLGCRTASKLVSFDGTQLAASYQYFPAPVNGLVFKIVRANSLKFPLGTQSDLIGKQKEACFVLPTDGECNSLEKFCRGADCKFSFFSPNNKCCEISAY